MGKLEDYVNRPLGTAEEIMARIERARPIQRLKPLADAIAALVSKERNLAPLRKLVPTLSTLTDEDWGLLQKLIAPRGPGAPRTANITRPTIHLAKLNYHDRLAILNMQRKAATGRREGEALDRMKNALIETVAADWGVVADELEKVLRSPGAHRKWLNKDRL